MLLIWLFIGNEDSSNENYQFLFSSPVSNLSQCNVRLAQNLRDLDCLWLMKLTPNCNGNIVCKYEWTKVSDASNFPYVFHIKL